MTTTTKSKTARKRTAVYLLKHKETLMDNDVWTQAVTENTIISVRVCM